MNTIDRQYIDLIEDITIEGQDIKSRNSMTRRVTTKQILFTSTPLVSVRRTAWKHALREMEWFLSGSNNIKDLDESVRHWWEPWTVDGFVFHNYGTQFRHSHGSDPYKSFDQIKNSIELLKKDPNSRRNIITTWNSNDMNHPATPITNCHGSIIQFFVNPDNTVDMTMYQRSADVMLGVPHNWIQYWAFLQYMCHQSGRDVGKFMWLGGDVHIYENHFQAAEECRNTAISHIETPILTYTPTSDSFKAEDFTLVGNYKPLIKKSLELIV